MTKFDTVKGVLGAVVSDGREEEARQAARRHWASVAKPLGSLGLLETALEDRNIPLHPGALKYYQEQNAITTDELADLKPEG